MIRVLGKEEPTRVYELLESEQDTSCTTLAPAFSAALSAYRQRDLETAEAGFRTCLEVIPEGPPSLVFLDRIKKLRERPPGVNWDGVWSFDKK